MFLHRYEFAKYERLTYEIVAQVGLAFFYKTGLSRDFFVHEEENPLFAPFRKLHIHNISSAGFCQVKKFYPEAKPQ